MPAKKPIDVDDARRATGPPPIRQPRKPKKSTGFTTPTNSFPGLFKDRRNV